MYLILGYARTAIAVESFFIEKNIPYKIHDDKISISEEKKFNQESDLLKIKRAVISPVFRTKNNPHNLIKILQENNIEIISDLDLFYENLKEKENKILIGITGTNGKSTTSALCFETLKNLGKTVAVCGNFGIPVISVLNKYDIYVIEVSSAQLEISSKIKFNISVILNITEDHSDYHGSFENYVKAKFKILKYSSFSFVDYNLVKLKEDIKNSKHIELIKDEEIESFLKNKEIQKFASMNNAVNLQSFYYVFLICKKLNFEERWIINELIKFKGLTHRIEFVKKIDNISIINDSKATNLKSTEFALKVFNENLCLIAGGLRKKEGFLDMNKNLLKKIKKVFLIGSAEESFASELQKINVDFEKCNRLEVALKNAMLFCKENKIKILLLSPLCASFDQYKDFEDRGNCFKKIVEDFKFD